MKLYLYSSLVCCATLLTGCAAVPSADAETGEAMQESAADAETDEDNELFTFPDLKSFTARTLDGSSVTEDSFAEADVTALNIWSTSCGPCVREMPELAEYAASLPDNLQVITWCLDAEYNPEPNALKNFLTECGYEGMTLISGTGDLKTLYKQLVYTPTTVFLDSEGNQVAEPIIGAGDIKEKYDTQFRAAMQELGIDSTI